MTVEDVRHETVRLDSRLAGAAVAMSVVAGYVARGAAVLVGRSLVDVARQTRASLPSLRGEQLDQPPREPKAA